MENQLDGLRAHVGKKFPNAKFEVASLSSGGVLISISDVPLGEGWNRSSAKVIFVQPPGYPGAAPVCFWVEPAGLRLTGGGTPQNTNDANAIPADPQQGRSTTWFSWHVQAWNPSSDRLVDFFQLILTRLHPAR
jgi:hypothetical protein